jgi:hypothetical protein
MANFTLILNLFASIQNQLKDIYQQNRDFIDGF